MTKAAKKTSVKIPPMPVPAEDTEETDRRFARTLKLPFGIGSGAQASIVPVGNVSSTALIFVIAIMTFLACLTLGAVTVVRQTANSWQLQIARDCGKLIQ